MLNFTETAIRLYRQIFSSPGMPGRLADGIETVLDGQTAVAVTEACITEVAAIGSSFQEQGAALAWLSEQQRVRCNLFDEKLSVQQADSARGALATALGVTQSGHRSTVFLTAQDLSSCQDLLQLAVGRRLPQVIHLDNCLSAMHGNSRGAGHETLHQVMDSGCFVLFASNVQEVVDFTLIARHVAEKTLTPALVVMDGIETALAAQNVRLPAVELVKQFVGYANERLDSPSVAQKQLFSEQRSRLHRWHDLDKPVLQGSMQDPEIYALGSAARKVYFEDLIKTSLDKAYLQYANLTGRRYATVSTYALKNADIIIIAQGSAIETIKTLSDELHDLKLAKEDTINLGVVGLHSMRPFEMEKLIHILHENKGSTQSVVVLERLNVPLADDAPLMREIRAALHRNREDRQYASDTLLENKKKGSDLPRLHSIIYGLGGKTLNIADVYQLCKEIKLSKNKVSFNGRYLGISFNSVDSTNGSFYEQKKTQKEYPKRQALQDTLQRYYPQISTLGIHASEKYFPSLAQEQVQRRSKKNSESHKTKLSVAISYLSGVDTHTAYAMELASYLYKLNGHYLRSCLSSSWEQWAKRHIDYVTQADKPHDAGGSSRVDFFMVFSTDVMALYSACQILNNQGVLFFTNHDPVNFFHDQKEGDSKRLAECFKLIKDKNLTLYEIDASFAAIEMNTLSGNNNVTTREIQWEKILATFMGVLLQFERINVKARKVISLRKSFLDFISESSLEKKLQGSSQQKKEQLINIFKLAMENRTPYNHQLLIADKYTELSANEAPIIAPILPVIDIPERVKKLGNCSETYDSLAGFWNQTGVLQRDKELMSQQTDEVERLTVDPFLATGTLPSLSATFNNINQHRRVSDKNSGIPSLDPQACTACGLCWVNCPDSAIAVVAFTPKALIETGINVTGADALRQVSKTLASRIAKRCRNNELDINTAGDLLNDAFDWLKAKSGLSDDRIKALQQDYDKAHLAIADLPIIASDLFFYTPEKKQNDSGELFSLAINPDTCKACGLCVELCASRAETPALTHVIEAQNLEETFRYRVQLKKQWQIWQNTPDTPSATIERILQSQSVPSGAALMLSRHNAFALSGGDQGELASAEKIAMRQLLSATEYHQQPLLYRFIRELEKLRNDLNVEINSILSEALPTDNLAQLSDKLSNIKTRQIDLNTLLEKSTHETQSMAIDAVKIRSLVDLVLQINTLHWQLSQGNYGLGRARYSLCITSSSIASWAGAFPHNPFHVPVNIDVTGESVAIAAGLVQGQIKDTLAAISLMRTARASVDVRYAKQNKPINSLDWSDLTHEEQQLCPPLILVGGDDLLGGQNFSQISLLLNSPYPVKMVIFSELDSGLVHAGLKEYPLNRRLDSRNNLAMMAMSQRQAYVAQTSIAESTHLQQSVCELLDFSAAGVLCIHTPSPQRHGFNPVHTLRQAKLAVDTRMFPLFRYNPLRDGVFGSRMSLEGNRDISHEWAEGLLSGAHRENKENDNLMMLNPVHWAIHENRFQSHFSALTSNTSLPIELSEWLTLSATEQLKKTPCMTISFAEKNSQKNEQNKQRVVVSREFSAMVMEKQSHWRTLQELAGIVTPFTDYVETCVEARLRSEHQAELTELRLEYEAKIEQVNANYHQETHTKIRNQLLGLAGYDMNNLRE